MLRSRSASLLIAVLLGFHLQMGVTDIACAAGMMADSAGAMPGMTMPAGEAPAGGTDQEGTSCNAPESLAGCKLMAPCVTGAFDAARERSVAPAVVSAFPQRMILLVPISRSFPPEPPPPRA